MRLVSSGGRVWRELRDRSGRGERSAMENVWVVEMVRL